MSIDDYERDRESGDSKAKITRDSDASPMQKYFDLLEEATVVGSEDAIICILSAANIASGILCGIEDENHKKKYYIAKPGGQADKNKRDDAENLYDLFDGIRKMDSKKKMNLRFFDKGVEGTVGTKFTIVGDGDSKGDALKAATKEADKIVLAEAQEALIMITAKLGEEGLVEPHRKLSVAGEALMMKKDILADMASYEVLKKDFEEREAIMIEQQADELKRMRDKKNATKDTK